MPLTDQHTENLLAACKKGNQMAQLEIYNRYQKAMFNVAYRIIKNRFEAEDIMQDSFLTAFGKLNDLKDFSLFGAWLKKIVVRNSLSEYRRKQKQNEIPIDQVLYKVENEEEILNTDYSNLKAKQILETMKDLKENYRMVLTLHLIEGYDQEEICEIMKISNANCRTMISRAKNSLRKKLQISAA